MSTTLNGKIVPAVEARRRSRMRGHKDDCHRNPLLDPPARGGGGAEGIVPGNLAADRRTATKTDSSVGTEGVGCAITTGGVGLNDGPNRLINRRLGRLKRREYCAAVGLPGNPTVRYSCWECRLRIGRAQANDIPWSNRAQKS